MFLLTGYRIYFEAKTLEETETLQNELQKTYAPVLIKHDVQYYKNVQKYTPFVIKQDAPYTMDSGLWSSFIVIDLTNLISSELGRVIVSSDENLISIQANVPMNRSEFNAYMTFYTTTPNKITKVVKLTENPWFCLIKTKK